MSRLVQALMLVLIPLSAGALWWLVESVPSRPDASLALEVDRARVFSKPPPHAAPESGREVRLPHDWRGNFAHEDAWYTFELNLAVPADRLWGVLLPILEQNAEVFLNGELVGSRGRFEPHPSRFASQPLYFPLANGLIRPGRNEFVVHVATAPRGRGLLGAIFVGPDAHLRPIYEQRVFVQRTLPGIFVIVSLAMTLMIVLLAWQRPRDSTYRWFAVQLALWTLQSALAMVVDAPFHPRWLTATSVIISTWFCATAFLFTLRFIDERWPRLERVILGAAVIGSVATLLATLVHDRGAYTVGPLSMVVQMAFGPFIMYRVLVAFLRERDPEFFMLLYTALILMAFGGSGWLIALGTTSNAGGRYMFYTTPILMTTVVVLMVRRFVAALRTSEELTAHLEDRVAEKSRELAENYTRLHELERERLLTAERERMMRDVHDGVGGQLVSSIAEARRLGRDGERLRATLDGALTDLRLVIDSLDGTEGDLNVALGMLRSRLTPQLAAAGITVRWQVPEVPIEGALTREVILDIKRIVQEAIANVIKHAGATEVRVSVAVNDDDLTVEVRDNGRGLGAPAGNGRGLGNMQRRAARIDATLDVENTGAGTAVRLRRGRMR